MKSRFVLVFALSGVSVFTGCFRSAHLYPVEGPLAEQTSSPVLAGKMTGEFNWGKLSVKLADGEVLSGPWKAISEKDRVQNVAGSGPSFNLASAWDMVYGQGFYNSHVLGTPLFARAALTGRQDTVLQVEMYREEHGSDTDRHGVAQLDFKGVAQDNKGNIYKLVL